MTSEERKENRYQRRKLKRKAKRDKLLSKYDSFYNVINRDALAEAANDARKGISWKGSVKRFHLRLIYNIAMLNNKLMYHKDIRKGFVCFYLYERGKKRDIMSVHFSERVVQKSFCKNAAIPILTHNLVYDNGASQKGKGTQFSVDRLKTHLHREYRRNGNNGYILLIDFSGYFANIQHEPLKKQLAKAFSDSSLLWLSYQFVDAYYDYNLKNGIDEHVGLGLGGEPNQAYAVSFPNSIDHFIKEQLHIKGFGAYMDDRYLIHKDKEYLKYCLEEIRKKCNELGITINEKKTHIVKLSHGFTFLKTQFRLTDSGAIVIKPCREQIVRERRKLKKQKKLLEKGEMKFPDVRCSYASWRGCVYKKGARRTVWNMDKLYNKLFIEDWRCV